MTRSKATIEIFNTIGRFAQYYSAKSYTRIADELFSDSDETSYEAPELHAECIGIAAVRDYFKNLKREGYELLLTHTHAIRFNEDLSCADVTWMGHCIITEGTEKATTEYGIKRFDAVMVPENGKWVFKSLMAYYFISFIPETYDMTPLMAPHTDTFESVLPPAFSGETMPEDYVGIQQTQSRWSQNKRADGMKLFASDDSVSMHYPLFFAEDAKGQKAVSDAIASLDEKEIENDHKFIDIPMITSAVIETAEDGKSAQGTWYVISNSIIGPAFGHNEFYCPNICRIGRFRQTFIKEEDGWKIQHFDLEYLMAMPVNTFDREGSRPTNFFNKEDNWLRPPVPTGFTKDYTEDVLEIEQLVTHWTYGIRYRSFARFYYDLFARERTDLVDPNFATGMMMFGMTDSFYEEQPKFCGFHCGTTPYVEVEEGGEMATAVWLDYGYTSFGEKFGFHENPFYANAGIARYEFKCVKSEGKWKMYNFRWQPFYRIRYLENYWRFHYMETKGWAGSDTTERFPLPFRPYHYVEARRDWTKPFHLDPPEISSPLEKQKGLVIGD